MRFQQILAFVTLFAPIITYAEPKVSVTVTDGPTECSDNELVKEFDYVKIHYILTIDESSETGEKGKQFQASIDKNQTFGVQIGAGKVIKGLDEGIVGLCKGAKATLVIPPEMGYDKDGAFGIPGNATVNFAVEVVDITDYNYSVTYEGNNICDEDDIVKPGDFITMHYIGSIDQSSETGEKGKQISSSFDKGQKPFEFQLGTGKVVKGLDEGLIGLCKGIRATIVLPPDMAYGSKGLGGIIPGGATMNFLVEVIDRMDGYNPEDNYFEMINQDGDNYLSKEEIDDYFIKLGHNGAPDEFWEREDEDKDGRISWDEFSGPKGGVPPGNLKLDFGEDEETSSPSEELSGSSEEISSASEEATGSIEQTIIQMRENYIGEKATDSMEETSTSSEGEL